MKEKNISLARLDLNLFVVFEAIVREGSISEAARSLHLTQPAVSHALARLRERLGDPLFVRQGRQMVATPRARELIQPVREALAGLQACVGGARPFDPSSAKRTFVLGLRDGLEACLLPPLMALLEREAPGLEVQSLTLPRRELVRELSSGRVDFVMDVPVPVTAEIQQQQLMLSPLSVLLRRGHPLARGRLTLKRYLTGRHVLVSSRRRGPGLEDFGLAQSGQHRQVALRCQHYQSALETVAATDLLLTLPAMLAGALADGRFVSRSLPLPEISLAIQLYWHRDREGDAGHGWLRESLAGLAPTA